MIRQLHYILVIFLFFGFAQTANAQTFFPFPVMKSSIQTPDGVLIPYVAGPMISGFTNKVIEAYMENPNGRLAIQSNGGDMKEGYKLGKFIEENKINLYVKDFCVSSCAFAALKANRVFFSDNAYVAFHAPYFEEIDPRFSIDKYLRGISLSTFALVQYFEETNMKEDFLFDILDKTSRDVYIIYTSNEELQTERVGMPDRKRVFVTKEQIRKKQQER